MLEATDLQQLDKDSRLRRGFIDQELIDTKRNLLSFLGISTCKLRNTQVSPDVM